MVGESALHVPRHQEALPSVPRGGSDELLERNTAELGVRGEQSGHDIRGSDAATSESGVDVVARQPEPRRVDTVGHPRIEVDHDAIASPGGIGHEPSVAAEAAVRRVDGAEDERGRDGGVGRRSAGGESRGAHLRRGALRRHDETPVSARHEASAPSAAATTGGRGRRSPRVRSRALRAPSGACGTTIGSGPPASVAAHRRASSAPRPETTSLG